jgi:hypothetical protein
LGLLGECRSHLLKTPGGNTWFVVLENTYHVFCFVLNFVSSIFYPFLRTRWPVWLRRLAPSRLAKGSGAPACALPGRLRWASFGLFFWWGFSTNIMGRI